MSNSTTNGVIDSRPKWLNESFLEKTLKSSEEDNVTVNSYQVSPATAIGDNYSSEMYRVKVSFTRNGNLESRSIIVKAEPSSQEMSKIWGEWGIFRREATALSTILPKLNKLLNDVSTERFAPFAAECLYSQSEPSAIVMEDLKEKGFKMAKRMIGFDMQHSLLVMRRMALYHATSAALYQKNPELFQSLLESVYCDNLRSTIEAFFTRSMKCLATEVEGWPEYGERFASKLKKLAEKTEDLLIENVKRDDSDFNVFTHGDMWLNNMMFLYSQNSEEVEEIRFVDFQMCHYTCPAIDIQYFLHTSVSLELVDEHQRLIQEYHETLGETLCLLGYEHLTPSLAQLQRQLDKKGIYVILTCATILPFIFADKSNIPDIENMMKGQEKPINFSEQCKRALKKFLHEFERKGWL